MLRPHKVHYLHIRLHTRLNRFCTDGALHRQCSTIGVELSQRDANETSIGLEDNVMIRIHKVFGSYKLYVSMLALFTLSYSKFE